MKQNIDELSSELKKTATETVWSLLSLFVALFVITRMWNWYMVPVFGVAAITMYHSLAMLFISKILFRGIKKSESVGLEEKKREVFFFLIVLTIGWVGVN